MTEIVTRVYRIETPEGFGPYTSECSPKLPIDRDRHSFVEDYGVHPEEFHYFGFESIDSLINWFDKDLMIRLINDENDWRITVYLIDSDEVISTPEQCVFNIDYAEYDDTIDLVTFVD